MVKHSTVGRRERGERNRGLLYRNTLPTKHTRIAGLIYCFFTTRGMRCCLSNQLQPRSANKSTIFYTSPFISFQQPLDQFQLPSMPVDWAKIHHQLFAETYPVVLEIRIIDHVIRSNTHLGHHFCNFFCHCLSSFCLSIEESQSINQSWKLMK